MLNFEYDTSNDNLMKDVLNLIQKNFFKNLNVNFMEQDLQIVTEKNLAMNKIDNYLSNKIKNLNLSSEFEKLLNIKLVKINKLTKK